jgi:hypothetical protein
MDRIAEFKPIQRLALPDVGDIDPRGLILVVGPNSSGKSQLLQDVYRRLSGEPRQLVVAEEMLVRKPELESFLLCLEREGYLGRIVDEAGNHQLRPLTTFIGSGQAAQQISGNQPSEWYRTFSPEEGASYRRKSEFLSYFGRLMVTGLFLDRRLTSVGQVGPFDFEAQPPQHDLHALYIDEGAKQNLLSEVITTFGKAVWVDASKANVICLRSSDADVLPSPEERLMPKKMLTYRTIETEGDGLKSYVATCIALLLGTRPVCVIDEPEMCLHPPQAYNLGRFIGRFGSSPDNCTFVATHSSHVLRGVIQTAPEIQILRLTRRADTFHAYRVDASTLAAALKKPTVRAESVLDGIFAQGVVIVEADTDRTVYQAVWETLQDELGLDIHFAPVGGTGGIADTLNLYRTLQIPVAVIADLDLLIDASKLQSVLCCLVEPSVAQVLISEADHIGQVLRALPPTISQGEASRRIGALATEPMRWDANDDVVLRRKLISLANDLDRMRRLKRGGIQAFPAELQAPVTQIVSKLATSGLFLVPVGELEGWLGKVNVGASRDNKWGWANQAARTVQGMGPHPDDIWAFMRGVGTFLQ